MSDAQLIRRERLLEGKVFVIERDEVTLPHGRTVKIDIVRHPKSVVLIPVPEAGHVVLIRQYRHPVGRWLWELPAGSVDEGESPEQAARRECHEEIGQVPDTIVRVGAMFPTPGYCDEEMIFYRLSGLSDPDEVAAVDEDEDIEARTYTIRDAREMVRRGEIIDMKTAVGLSFLT